MRGFQPAILLGLTLAAASAFAQNETQSLARNFVTPPESAKPRTWWHWTSGNVTEDGITKDLEWMKRSGIGGFQLVDVSSGGGQSVERKINFGTPEWYHAVRHSAEEAKRLGLEMSIFSSPGWSEAGGPWVKPEAAMKKLVWSETTLTGPQHFSAKLASPPDNEGPVRDSRAGSKPEAPHFYADSAVVAYRTPDAPAPTPAITTSAGAIDTVALLDNSLQTSITLPAPKDGSPAWVQYAYAEPFTARALSLGSGGRIPVGRLLASDDGKTFRTIADFPGPQGYHGASIRTFAFPATTAKFFRIELTGAGLTPAAVIHGGPVLPAPSFTLTEAILFADARVNRFEDKTAAGSLMDVYDVVPTPAGPGIDRSTTVDLTSRLDRDGTLHWDVPAGHWTILRMGYSLTGAKNRPSVPAGSGYEVDKLSAKYVREYFHGYIDPLQQSLGDLLGSTAHYMTMDSWEAGMQNWTGDMLAQFERRRGYDPHPWLPVLAGRVVESGNASDRFLWDFRRTLADMYAEEFYGAMADELHKKGMAAYAEASGVALEIPEDTLLNKSRIDIPMAEFWVRALHPESMYYVDVRGAASAAHVYGKPIVATESFTGGGYESPYTLKKIADYWFAQGVNRLVFHTSAHQPLDTKPGNTMVGTHLNRNITWAEQSKPFMTYLARVSYMLQQGKPVADLAYLLPEGAPSTMPFWGSGVQPAPPAGYDYDFLNTDILLHHTSVTSDGGIHVDAGPTYRLLVLPPATRMTPEVARKLHELVSAGATITGPRPAASPSLAHYATADAEVQALAEDLWAGADGVTLTQHGLGKGTVYSGLALDEILRRLNTPTDFSSSSNPAPAWIHRRTQDADIYFIANQSDAPMHLDARFRSTGKVVSIWRPMDGSMTAQAPASGDSPTEDRSGNRETGLQPAAYVAEKRLTTVPLDLAERESVFVVFTADAAPATVQQTHANPRLLTTLNGPWTVAFPEHAGAPATVQLSRLSSWTENADPGVKYFSGTATYSRTVTAPAAWLRGDQEIWLDLGKVRDLAEVKINGKSAGLVWAPPYRVNITGLLHAGVNRLKIGVTNEWTNRQIGDRLLPENQRILAPGPPAFGRSSTAPPESGLIGDVRILGSARMKP